MLERLITTEITINSANADQIFFIINLMHGYDELDMLYKDSRKITNNGEFFHSAALTKANKIFKASRANEKNK